MLRAGPHLVASQPAPASPSWPPSAPAPPRSKNKRLVAIRSGLLVSRGGTWGSLRAAMNPLFHTQALQAYNPVINSCGGWQAGLGEGLGEGEC